MTQAQKVLESASRRELQALAKELQLCRGNAKSDVIMSHAMQFLENHPKDGEQRLLGVLGGSDSAPSAVPVAKKEEKKQEDILVVKVDTNAKQSKSDKEQPEDEPVVTVNSVEVVQTKATVDVEKKTTPKKKMKAKASKEEEKMTPKDKKKANQTSSLAAPTPKSSSTTAVKSPKTAVKVLPAIKKSPSSKTQPSGNGKKEQPAVSKKPSLLGKKAEMKGRKALEALVKSMPDLTFSGDARVRCSTTGHEMKADVDVINAYLHGKRYQKARNLKLSFAKYAPMFVDHPDETKPDMLWCYVTESAIARDVKRVEAHIAAPKYQKELPLWKEQEAAKKKAEEEEAQRRAARIAAAKKRRLETENGAAAAESKRPTKRNRTTDSARK